MPMHQRCNHYSMSLKMFKPKSFFLAGKFLKIFEFTVYGHAKFSILKLVLLEQAEPEICDNVFTENFYIRAKEQYILI